MPESERPSITHQSGVNQFDELLILYKTLKVEASVVQFIDDTSKAFADADLIICRAGAITVTEITAVGAAAIFVPLPSAVDDHQTKNAMYLVQKKAAWLRPQHELTPENLAKDILQMNRKILLDIAQEAKKLYVSDTVNKIVNTCEGLVR
jgi:UDP-N-acetylglucosamine--N-acetylmuramyl-(pentapeptide) pyrophosphoryl-undecaprenol N-acetylglucosamine transferase